MAEFAEREHQNRSMGLYGSKAIQGGVKIDEKFYGVYLPTSNEDDFLHVYEDKDEALKVVKNHKKARFKAFQSRADAVAFAVHGPENMVTELGNDTATNILSGHSDAEKPSPFKGPKPQDLVLFRKAIESGNLEVVSKTVWENPRFLISSGDTPSILQEGARYNALHVAAKSKNAVMTDFILQTVGNPAFAKLLYGDETVSGVNFGSSVERSAIFLDLYLNTPDKGMHETPLHFASKFGAELVVACLVSYSECAREPMNKFGQRPIDIVGARCPNATNELKTNISALLQNDFYVPVLRAEDNTVQPTVGTPFSPKDPPTLNDDPLSPRLEIHAFAGPMTQTQANDFHRRWRTPSRASQSILSESPLTNKIPTSVRLRDPQKGLERVGRNLAADCRVPWKEYWSFLDTFVDLSSSEGLDLLEEYLSRRYRCVEGVLQKSGSDGVSDALNSPCNSVQVIKANCSLDGTDTEPEIISPVTQLCSMMNACTIIDDSLGSGIGQGSPLCSPSPSTSPLNGSIRSSSSRFFDWLSRKRPEVENNEAETCQNEAILTAMSNPTVSPFLYVEKSLQLFAKRIAASLQHLVSGIAPHNLNESIRDVLKPEVKRVQSLVGSYLDDARFVAVDYHLVHSRIARSVAERLVCQLTWEEREVFYNGLQAVLAAKATLDTTVSSDDDDNGVPSNTPYRLPRATRQSSSSHCRTAIRCIVEQMVWALDQLQGKGPDGRSPLMPRPQVRTENECLEMWSDAYPCLCSWRPSSQFNISRGSRKSSSMKRTINSSHSVENQNVSRRLDYGDKDEFMPGVPKDGDLLSTEAGCPLEEEDNEDDLFFTPPSSPRRSVGSSDSEDEMDVPGEGPVIFIEGNEPSQLDADIVNIISSCNITESSHPYIFRWKHDVLLHSVEQRERWPTRVAMDVFGSPTVNSVPSTPNCVSTPVSVSSPTWSRVTGLYSPLPRKSCNKA